MRMVGVITSNILKEPRSVILGLLKRGGLSVEELSRELGFTKVGVRRHLELLKKDGLVQFEVVKHERGRPSHVYSLTSRAEVFFPRNYESFALGVLRQIESAYGTEAVCCILGRQADELIANLRPELDPLDFEQKIIRMTELMSARGFDVDLQRLPDGDYLLRQRNCPTVGVASKYGQVCDEELRLYRELLCVDVIRECRIVSGALNCDYRVRVPGGPIMPSGREGRTAGTSS
ncbi:MAG: helix-turn-helix transcriptional regulator [Blastocatellia bacterium]